MRKNGSTYARTLRFWLAAGVVALAFLSSYGLALARGRSAQVSAPVPTSASAAAAPTAACACCSGGAPTKTIAGEAVLDGGVQRITIDASSGQFRPNAVTLKAGVPSVLTFGQGQGCLAQVVFPELGVTKDLTQGGATVELPALKAGEYTFACGMNMVFGSLSVR